MIADCTWSEVVQYAIPWEDASVLMSYFGGNEVEGSGSTSRASVAFEASTAHGPPK